MANKIKTQFSRISKKITRYSFVLGCSLGLSFPLCSSLEAQERFPVINGRITIDSLITKEVAPKPLNTFRNVPEELDILIEEQSAIPTKHGATIRESEYKIRDNGNVKIDSLNSTWKKSGQYYHAPELVPAPAVDDAVEENSFDQAQLVPAPAASEYGEAPQYYDVADTSGETFLQVQSEVGTGKAGAHIQSDLSNYENESDFFVIQEQTKTEIQKHSLAPQPNYQVETNYEIVEDSNTTEELQEASHTRVEKPGVFSLELEPVSASQSVEPLAFQESSNYSAAASYSKIAAPMNNTQTSSGNKTSFLTEQFENIPLVSNVQQFSPASMIGDFSEETFENISQINPVFNNNQTFQGNGTTASMPLPVTWTVTAEAMYLHRSDAEGSEALILCNDNGVPVDSFTGGDLDYDNELGMRFQVERRNPDGSGFHVEYFGVNDWSDMRTITHTDLTVLNTNIGSGSGAISSESEFHSFEVNGRRDYDAWTNVFAGFRVLVLDETTAISGTGNAGNVFSQIDIENNMYGAQVGFDRSLYDKGGVFSLNTTFNLGLFYNSINTHTINFPPGFAGSDNAASLLREWNFDMNLQLTDSVSVAGGYTLIWLDDVALGPNQFLDRNNSVNADSNVFTHGGTLGLTYIW